jgi:rSAM/selenodomain-associated transferase 1
VTSNDSLIIFSKNPDQSRAKNLLDQELGEEQAKTAYHKLLLYTKEITKKLNCDKSIYYSSHIDNNDLWDNMIYSKSLQQGNTKGESLADAFNKAFAAGKKRVIIIGTDCIDLESYMIKEAFAVLENNDIVLGPFKTGGYYLLGMSKFLPTLLTEKDWESENLLMDTILDLKNLDSKYYLLKTLSDVETADDLNRLSRFQQKDNEWF